MISILDLGLDVLAYRVDGKVKKADIVRVFEEVDVRLAAEGKFNVYLEVVSIPSISLPGLLKEIRLGFKRLDVLQRVGKAALVTDNDWLRMAARFEDKVLHGIHIRVFRMADQIEAQTWVRT